MCICFIMLAVHGHGRGMGLGTCLVLQTHASCVVSLQHVSMFQYAGCVWGWTRKAPWYVPCASAACVGCREFATFAYVSFCWLWTFEYAACARAWTRYMPNVYRICCGLCCMLQWLWAFCFVFGFITPFMHGHGRCKRLGTCLVLELRVEMCL